MTRLPAIRSVNPQWRQRETATTAKLSLDVPTVTGLSIEGYSYWLQLRDSMMCRDNLWS